MIRQEANIKKRTTCIKSTIIFHYIRRDFNSFEMKSTGFGYEFLFYVLQLNRLLITDSYTPFNASRSAYEIHGPKTISTVYK